MICQETKHGIIIAKLGCPFGFGISTVLDVADVQ